MHRFFYLCFESFIATSPNTIVWEHVVQRSLFGMLRQEKERMIIYISFAN